jgi:hypothetical protein
MAGLAAPRTAAFCPRISPPLPPPRLGAGEPPPDCAREWERVVHCLRYATSDGCAVRIRELARCLARDGGPSAAARKKSSDLGKGAPHHVHVESA